MSFDMMKTDKRGPVAPPPTPNYAHYTINLEDVNYALRHVRWHLGGDEVDDGAVCPPSTPAEVGSRSLVDPEQLKQALGLAEIGAAVGKLVVSSSDTTSIGQRAKGRTSTQSRLIENV